MADASKTRFLAMADVAEVLSISVAQVYALVRRGDLPAIKIGGRGQWRVEIDALESYIADAYSTTRSYIRDHPYAGDEAADGTDDETGDGTDDETGDGADDEADDEAGRVLE